MVMEREGMSVVNPMRSRMIRSTCVSFVTAFLVACPAFAGSLADLIERIEPSCVRVDVRGPEGTGIGSGFIAREGDWVVTNYHVVAGMKEGRVQFSDESTADIEGFLAYDKSRDIAVIKIKIDEKRTPLSLLRTPPRKGETAIAIGAPQGLSFTATEGIISALRTGADLRQLGAERDGDWIQISVPISPGNSGGPVLNTDGSVIGMSTMGVVSGQNLNFAISSADILSTLERAATATVRDLAKIEPPSEQFGGGRPKRPGARQMPDGDAGGPEERIKVSLPASRRFTHRYAIAKEVDDFDKVTWLRSQWIPLKHQDPRLSSFSFRFGIPFNEDGASAVLIWEMAATSRSILFGGAEGRRLQLLGNEGQPFSVVDPKHKAGLNPAQFGGWIETMTAAVRIDHALDIALSKKEAKGRLGTVTFRLGPEELECLRDFLSKIPSGTATFENITMEVTHLALEDDPTAPPALAKAAKSAKSGTEKRERTKALAGYREWASADGNFTIDARYISSDDENVQLKKRDGREITMPVASLSEADQKFLATLKEAKDP
jgi:S1-C subfamily serine protease